MVAEGEPGLDLANFVITDTVTVTPRQTTEARIETPIPPLTTVSCKGDLTNGAHLRAGATPQEMAQAPPVAAWRSLKGSVAVADIADGIESS